MDQFQANHYFDLLGFEHEALFQQGEPVWEPLKKLDKYLHALDLGKNFANVDPGAFLINPEEIFLGEGTVVEAGAYIRGPCFVGKRCQIRHGAYIRGQFLAGDDCVIGHATEVKNAIFLNHALAGHFAYIGDSILGNKVNLGAGTKCANLRLDQKEITLRFEQKKVGTGLRKLGAILGDGVQIGCNAVTNPGTFMGKEARCYPCVNARGIIPAKHVVKHAYESILALIE